MKNNDKAPIWFLMVFIIIGSVMLFFGTREIYKTYKLSQTYLSVEGQLINYDKYDSDDGTTYYLIYSYEVNGVEYNIRTDYSTGSVPDVGTNKTIRYNPDNPNEAYIVGFSGSWLLVFVGGMFAIVPVIPILSSLNPKTEVGNRLVGKIITAVFGLLFIGMGILVFFSIGSNWSIFESFRTSFFLTLVAFLFTGVGIYILISPFLLRKMKPQKLMVEKIEVIDNIYRIIFSDLNISEGSFKASVYKYFLFETTETSLKEGYIYEVDIYKYGAMLNSVTLSGAVQARVLRGFQDSDFKYLDYKVVSESFENRTEEINNERTVIDKIIEDEMIGRIINKLAGLKYLIGGIIFIAVILWLILIGNLMIKISLIPFLICAVGVLITGITILLGKEIKLGKTMYDVGFLIFWFGFLVIFDYIAIRDRIWIMFLISLIFWAVGVFILIKLIKGKD